MTIKYGEFEHPTDFGFTGSAGKAHVKGYVRGGPVKRKTKATKPTSDLSDLPMEPIIKSGLGIR